MRKEPIMNFGNLRREIIANLTNSHPMSTSEVFDCYDRIAIEVDMSINSHGFRDPEYTDFIKAVISYEKGEA